MGGNSKGHNWVPKLVMRYFNFGLGNANRLVLVLDGDHFFLFAGRRAVESTGPTGFCIIVYVGIKRPARAKKTNSPASFFVFRVVNVCGPVADGGRRTVDDDDDSLFHLPPSP